MKTMNTTIGEADTTRAWMNENIEKIAGYLRQGFDVYVYAHGDTEKLDYTPLSTNTRWSYSCGVHLIYIFPHFEGGAPDMVNDFIELLSDEETEELEELRKHDEDYDLDQFIAAKEIDTDERQVQLWLDLVDYDEYAVSEDD